MAVYEYRCTHCHHQFTIELSMADKLKGKGDNITCPLCSAKAEQIFSASGVVFKGSGFFNTDRRTNQGSCGSSGDLIERAGKHRNNAEQSSPAPCSKQGDTAACAGCAHAQ